MIELFIRRTVLTTLLMVTILLFGSFSYKLLPVNVLPTIDFPTIQISASLPGADPETMASSVALPLEKQFSTIANIDSMNSISTTGSTQVILQFSLDRDIDAAAQDVQSAISLALKQLPADLPNPPSFRKVNPSDAPIFYLALTSDTMPLSDVDYYAETIIAERLSMLPGVAQVQVYGSQQYALRLQVDPYKMAVHRIGLDGVTKAINQSNVNLPTGALYGKNIYSTIFIPGQLKTTKDYNNLVLTYNNNGLPIFFSNIGKAVDSVVNNKVAAWYNNKRGIILAIQRQPNTNTLEVTASIQKMLGSLRDEMPSGINMSVLFDRSGSIKHSVNDVKFTLILALILVILVIFVFLRNITATFIPALALPLSIIGAFCVMYVFNYSIDNLSLMAFTLATGFVVDDAIVVLENITRHLEQGKNKFQAVLDGTKEIVFTIISMTLSLAAVFIPLLFMGGILGRLLHEFAVVIITTVIISGVISITITPMLCNLLLSEHALNSNSTSWSERAFNSMRNIYQKSLQIVIDNMFITIIMFFVIFIATIYLFTVVHKGFLPDEDNGQISMYTEAAQNISFEAMVKEQKQVIDIVLKNPHIEALAASVGASGRNSSLNQGSVFITLKPIEHRPSAQQIIKDLREKLSDLIGVKVYLQSVGTLTIGGLSSKSQYQYTLQGINQTELFNFARKIEERFKTVDGFLDVTSDLQISKPQTLIEVDRDKATKLGISMEEIQSTFDSAYGGQQISTIYTDTDQYQVILELDPRYQTDSSMLSLLYLTSAANVMVPLDSVAKVINTVGPLSISHFGQIPSVTISFNLKPEVSLSEAIGKINIITNELEIPGTIKGAFQGTAQAFQSSIGDMGSLTLVAIIVIYIVLGMLYESFLHPITILSGLPTAGFGAIVTLILFNQNLDIYGFVGLIMLIGIVKKNAIIIIDFALEIQRTHNKPSKEAVYEACLVRFRPIIMTTFVALVASLPIALGIGTTGSTRRSLGLAVTGGLLTSQILTLYITPVIFLYLESAKNWLMRNRKILHV